MSHPVIPAPVRFDDRGRPFALRSGTKVARTTAAVAPIVEWFCSEVARRTGLRVGPMADNPVSGEPSVVIELASADDVDELPSPRGISPMGDNPADERHSLVIDGDQVVVRAPEPVGIARALTTLVQLIATAPRTNAGDVSLAGAQIIDGPRYAWRGLSLDVARASFTLDEVRRVIDLLALYKLNVLHVHLTDDQSWRLPVGRAGDDATPDGSFYDADDLGALVAYAAERFVTVVPEIETPGHVTALVEMHPELRSGRNEVAIELAPDLTHRTVWLDPELPATFDLINDVLSGVAAIFPSAYIHIGGDESFGMPDALYVSHLQQLRSLVRSLGKRPLGWQESARAGLGPNDVIQYWIDESIPVPAGLPPQILQMLEENVALSGHDIDTAATAAASVIVSPAGHCYLDVPYAEPSADPAQAERQDRLGLRFYPPKSVAEAFDWEPDEALGPGRDALVAGVEAAMWAETISDFDDLSFLLLPRLAGIAHRAWSSPHAGAWSDHRDRLARHGRLWTQDELTYFRTATVDWH